MDKQSEEAATAEKKPKLLAAFAKNYSGSIAGVALSVLSAWMIVTGLKGLAGFDINRQTALADLLGIVILIGIARWIHFRKGVKQDGDRR